MTDVCANHFTIHPHIKTSSCTSSKHTIPVFQLHLNKAGKRGLGFGASGVQKGHGDGFPTWVCEEHLFRNLSLAHIYCNYERESLVETRVLKGAVTVFLLELER